MTASPDRAAQAHDSALWPSQLVAQIAEQRPHSPWSPGSSPFASFPPVSSSFIPSPRAPSPRAPSPRAQAPAAPSPAAMSPRPRASVAAGDAAAPSAPSFARFLAVVTTLAFLLTFLVCSVLDML